MDESQLLISRIEDLIWNYDDSSNAFLGFLNEREAALACSYLKNRNIDYSIYGGYSNATRVYLTLSTEINMSDFPITAVSVVSKGKRELTHRDYLGSLMGMGLKRECIGDIMLQNKNQAVMFLRNDIVDYVLRELQRIGHESVVASIFSGNTDDFIIKTEEMRIIISSMRVDNVLSSIIGCSRSQAVDLINDDCVFVNYCQVVKPSMLLSDTDVLSIRGHGKFIVGELQGKTKRERLILNVLRYI